MNNKLEPSDHYKALTESQKSACMYGIINKLDESEKQFFQDYCWDIKGKSETAGAAKLIAGTIKVVVLIGLGFITSKVLF